MILAIDTAAILYIIYLQLRWPLRCGLIEILRHANYGNPVRRADHVVDGSLIANAESDRQFFPRMPADSACFFGAARATALVPPRPKHRMFPCSITIPAIIF